MNLSGRDAAKPPGAGRAGTSLEARALSLAYPTGVLALDGVDASVSPGAFVSLVGPSGCGKSTLLRVFAGLLDPTGGTARVGGVPPRDARTASHEAAFVFQQAALLPWRTVEANVALPLELEGKGTVRSPRVSQALELVGLSDFRRAYPHTLSGGMQMRVSVARALAAEPDVLLLDEPFGALDEITRQKLNEDLLAIWMASGWTGVFVTHNVFEAVFLSQRILVMSARPGRIAREIAVPHPYPRPGHWRGEADFAALCGEVSLALEEAARPGGGHA